MDLIYSIDFAILDFIQQFIKCAFLDIPMMAFSYLGEAGACWILAGIIMLFFKKTRSMGIMILVALAFIGLTSELVIKNIVARPRPFVINTDVTLNIHAPSGYSFPSNHSSLGFAASIIIFLRGKKSWGAAAMALALLIAFSRLYNYVHFPSDVLCGILFGLAVGAVTYVVFRKTGPDKRISRRV